MKRAALLLAGLLVLAALATVIGLSLWTDAAPAPAVPTGEEPATGPVETERRDLAATPISDTEARRRRLRSPWPFEAFQFDIKNALKPTRRAVFFERYDTEMKHFEVMLAERVTLQMENFRVEQVVEAVAPQFAESGLTVFTQEPYLPEGYTFDRIQVFDATIQEIISILREKSDGLVTYKVTPNGLCIGTREACYQASIDANEWERVASERVGATLSDQDLLDVEYRPDFDGAHIGRIIDDILTKTGVEVIADEQAWSKPVSLSWRTEPLPLRVALRGIAQQLEVTLQVYDGRAFLLGR